jgi:8-oxo-dGTP pyrophosphatase MutT (NUDIX family)
MISDKFPNFNPINTAAGCFIEHDGKILLLHRTNSKHDNNKWGCPGGKQEPHETDEETAVREIFEETGLRIESKKLVLIGRYNVRFPKYDFIYIYYTDISWILRTSPTSYLTRMSTLNINGLHQVMF